MELSVFVFVSRGDALPETYAKITTNTKKIMKIIFPKESYVPEGRGLSGFTSTS